MVSAKEKNAIFEVSLKFIIKNEKGEMLLLKMPTGGPMSGYYDLPGGRIKEYEKIQPFGEIFSRELGEELGENVRVDLNKIPVAIGRHNYVAQSSGEEQFILWVLFEGRCLGGEIEVSLEHEEYMWAHIKKDNLEKYFVQGPFESMYHYLYGDFPKTLKRQIFLS